MQRTSGLEDDLMKLNTELLLKYIVKHVDKARTLLHVYMKESIYKAPDNSHFGTIEANLQMATGYCNELNTLLPKDSFVLPKVKATEEFLAFLIVSKLDDRQPLYHLEKQLRERFNIDCSRQSMARWLIDLMFPLRPIYNLLKDSVIEYDIASCDATSLLVLNEPGRRAETKSYVYCMRGGAPGQSVVLYEYNALLHKKFVQEWFDGFSGHLHVDGDDFFELVGKFAKLVNCNAHARRKFEPITQNTKGNGLAKEAMRYFKELYRIEREAKEKQFTPEQRYTLRQEKSKPLIEKIQEMA